VKKRNEILQMILLDSELSILDETDSGLDIDALKIISNGINNFMSPDKSIILITLKIVRLRKSRLCSRDARGKLLKLAPRIS
jgi:Fe-S cluster assembly ATPase SufC